VDSFPKYREFAPVSRGVWRWSSCRGWDQDATGSSGALCPCEYPVVVDDVDTKRYGVRTDARDTVDDALTEGCYGRQLGPRCFDARNLDLFDLSLGDVLRLAAAASRQA